MYVLSAIIQTTEGIFVDQQIGSVKHPQKYARVFLPHIKVKTADGEQLISLFITYKLSVNQSGGWSQGI